MFFSGYSFICGYIRGLIAILILSKLFKKEKIDILVLYIPNMLIMNSTLKIGCYINECCYGIVNFPIQLIETIINFFAVIYVLVIIYKKGKV